MQTVQVMILKALLVVALVLTSSCARLLIPTDDVPLRPPDGYFPHNDWRTSTPEAQGLDSEAVVALLDTVAAKRLPIHSLQIVRYGHLVVDAYFFPFLQGERHDVASITKSITTTLIGLAIDRGALPSVDTVVYPLLESGQPEDVRKQQIRLRDLLSNMSGLDCGLGKFEREMLAMTASTDWVRFALDLPMRGAPGVQFSYCSPGFHLLSAVVSRRTGMAADAFARQNLFAPLGITDVRWPRDPQGISQGAGDLQLRPTDLLKVGYLFLRQGEWEGRQIVSRQWIREATRGQIATQSSDGYGFGWWVSRDIPGMYQAAGRGGQRLIVWPAKDIVVVMTAGGFDPAQLAPLLLRVVKSNAALPENPVAHARMLSRVHAATMPVQTHESAPPLPARAAAVHHRVYALGPNPLEIRAIELLFFDRSAAEVRVLRHEEELVIPVGLDQAYRFGTNPVSNERVSGRGRWTGPDDFVLEVDSIARINYFTLVLHYEGDRVYGRVSERAGLIPETEIAGRVQH